MLPKLMGNDYNYDIAVTDFINADLDGDGIVQKEEYVQRKMALDWLAERDYLKAVEYPYSEEFNKEIFTAMDRKYYRGPNNNVIVGDPNNEIDRKAFKAFAPEYLKL